jgi:3-phytase
VVQDGENAGRQNFKLFAWDDVAGGRLVVDTTLSARAGRAATARRDARP